MVVITMIKNLEIITVAEGTHEFPRNSEGSVIELINGELFIIWQRYEKSEKDSEDDAPNKLVSMSSKDGGRTWRNLRIEAVPKPGDVNVYSPNLTRHEFQDKMMFSTDSCLRSNVNHVHRNVALIRELHEKKKLSKQ